MIFEKLSEGKKKIVNVAFEMYEKVMKNDFLEVEALYIISEYQ